MKEQMETWGDRQRAAFLRYANERCNNSGHMEDNMNTLKEDNDCLTATQAQISNRCREICRMLINKNRAYGDSALQPIGVMTNSNALDLIATRIDDKLSRIKNQGGLVGAMSGEDTEDSVMDLIGYLILALVCASSVRENANECEEDDDY